MSEGTGEYSEKHSRFLGFVIPCEKDDEAAYIIAQKRKEHWDARHAVYAYILADGTARFSDDGEPHGTAGKPVLDVLSASGIRNAVVVVVRYFGGILLGTGGLVRAYTAAAKLAIENCGKAKAVPADSFCVNLEYPDYDRLLFLLKDFGAEVKNADFADKVSLRFTVKSNMSDNCIAKIKEAFSSSVVPKFEEKTVIYQKI